MLSGIYSVKFSSNLGDLGLGIAVFDKGKINGGDLTYLYRGKYNIMATSKLVNPRHEGDALRR
ncbi:MAG: hypothetical protein KME25_08695 [Symplocastrum torsivum CPER-KK1]|jgi:hypothetical protein|uniref:Uncharacterized protein n=1 Tax=Symplocastrum torsivum CPER-KK1 TaxID=450513 RepID=A0A951PJ99_9CYAN|nr:hypothetical protein [Symplocastrum torsivum CPER-KK1]